MAEKKPSLPTQLRRRKAVQGLLAGKSVTDALVEAGYAPSTARQASEVLSGIRDEFAAELDRQLPRDGMVSALVEGLSATKAEHIYNPKAGESRKSGVNSQFSLSC